MEVQIQSSDPPAADECQKECTAERIPNLEATCEKLEDLHLLEPPVVNESRACGDDQEEGDSSDLSNGEQKAKAESSLKDIPVIRDPSVERLMSTYSTAAQQMKQVIVDAIKSRLDAECGSTDGNLPEEEAIKKLAVLKQAIQKNAAEAALSSRPADDGRNDSLGSTSGCSKDPDLPRKAASPARDRLSVEKSPPPALAASAKNTVKSPIVEKTSAEQTLNAAVSAQPKSPCCGSRKSPVRKLAAQESNSINSTAGSKRKGERAVENVLKILEPHETAEEKLGALFQHYLGFQEGTWQLQGSLQRAERQVRQLSREKEQLQTDCNRALLAKSKLEGLCRELQRQGKVIKEECMLRIREEEEKRKEVASKFQSTLLDITAVLEENQTRSLQLKNENADLVQKLKSLIDHYDLWEKNVDQVLHQKELQVQVATTHLARYQAQLQQERQLFLGEKQQVLQQVADSQRQTAELAAREAQLHHELAVYSGKYQEFQGALSQSNQVFRTFKADMDKMSKKIKKLEKETVQWKTRWESSNTALADLTSEKQKQTKELLAAQQRVITLEKLCRALQLERNQLNDKLKGDTSTTDAPAEAKEQKVGS